MKSNQIHVKLQNLSLDVICLAYCVHVDKKYIDKCKKFVFSPHQILQYKENELSGIRKTPV